jgi:photosystem II stability/assembly factor-like uncharacterized protein
VGGDNGTLLNRKTALSTWSTNTLGSGAAFTDVSCTGPTNCVAVAGRSFYHTSNSGQNWDSVNAPNLRPDILNVSCVDSNNCAAVGYSGYVYYKENGGAWTDGGRIDPGAPPNLYDVDCKPVAGNQPTCYAVAAIGHPGRIFRSLDGGANYLAVYTPTPDSGTDVTLNAISCPALNTCYAVGSNGVIMKGGNTNWTAQYNSTDVVLSGISCPDVNTCYAVGGNVGYIIGTKDGGATWNLLDSPSTPVNSDLNDISCPSLNICHAVGNAGTLVTSIDGGKNWITEFRKPAIPEVTGNIFAITCPTTAYCLGVGASLTSLTTLNGNLGWQGTPLGPKAGFSAAACPGATTCFVSGTGASLYTKNGADWTILTTASLADISCPNTSECYAPIDGSSDIFITRNGGASWTREDLGTIGLSTISCPASNTCFGASTGGDILGYNGSSWVAQPKVVTFNLNGISCPNSGTCFAVGFNTDFAYLSGGTWSKRPLGGNYALTSISCPDSNACYAATNNGGVLVTKNGGTTWSLKTTGLTGSLYDISCPTTTDCVATGTSGAIAATRDGGDSWVLHASGTKNSLRGVQCNSVAACVAVGDNGTLLVGSVIHSLKITSGTDNGQGATFGTLSFALRYARPGQSITFDQTQISGVNAASGLPQAPYGVGLTSPCANRVTITGGAGVPAFELSGNNTLNGLNFSKMALKTTGTANKIGCSSVKLPG